LKALPDWNKRRIAVALIIVALAAGIAALMVSRAKKDAALPLKIIPDHVDIQAKDVLFTDVGADGTKWEIRADKGIYLRKENKALFEKVVVKLVLPDGGVYRMQGDQGELGTESRDMSITGHVILDSDRGDRVKVDTLNYSNKERVIRTDSAVVHENDRIELRGKGMVLSLTKREFKLLSNVRALIKR